jgi:hypothetical protein
LTFNEPIAADDGTPDSEVSLTCAGSPCGIVEAVSITDNELTVDISGIPDETCLAITVGGLSDLDGHSLTGDTDVHIVVLLGDVNGDGNANLIDMAFVKSMNGVPLAGVHARFDLNLDGNINLIDMALAKSCNGAGPAACP